MPVTPTLHVQPVPRSQPPYDDELAARPAPAATQGSLALAYVLPGGLRAVPEPPAQLRLLPDPEDPTGAADDDAERFAARRRTCADELPEPRRWTARLAQAVAEALAGHRPVPQLLPWLDPDVYATVAMRAATARSRPGGLRAARPTVRSVRVTSPCDGVLEAGAVVQAGLRCRALALRLEGLDGRWRCTALEVI